MRVVSLALFVAAVALFVGGTARAQLPVAPSPREVRPDGTRDPVPAPESPAKAEDPAAVVERIINNSKAVGDKLAMTDTGIDTRKKQDKILSDIDALIDRQENPPPPKPNDNKDQNKDDKNKDKNDDPMKGPDMPPPMGGDMPKDKKGMDNGMDPGKQDGMPMGGMGDPPPMGGRKPRRGDPMENDKKEPGEADAKPDPKGGKQPAGGKDDPKNKGAAGGDPGGKPPPKASLPFDDDVAKDVWGHLPDKLRRQMTQYYKEDVMPKYAELLRLYYSSLSEGAPPVMPRK